LPDDDRETERIKLPYDKGRSNKNRKIAKEVHRQHVFNQRSQKPNKVARRIGGVVSNMGGNEMDRLYGGLVILQDHNGNIVKCTQRIFGLGKESKHIAIEWFKESLQKHEVAYSDSWKFTARKYDASFSDTKSDEVYFFCKTIPNN
jgi:hypothetical protein